MAEAQNYKNDFEIYSDMFKIHWFYFLFPLNISIGLSLYPATYEYQASILTVKCV